MERKFLSGILIIITYTILLVLAILKFDYLFGAFSALMTALTPMFLGFAIAFVLSRPCSALERTFDRWLSVRAKKLARPLAVASSYVLLLLIIGGLLAFVIPQLGASILVFLSSLEGSFDNLQLWLTQLFHYFDLESLANLQLDFTQITDYLNKILGGMAGSVGTAAGHMVSFTGAIVSYIVTITIALVFSAYLLASGDTLNRQCDRVMRAYLPKSLADRIQRVVDLSRSVFSNFISGQMLEAVILGGLCTLGTLFIQADYAPLVGVVVGVSSLVPMAGAYIGAIFGAFVILMVSPIKALIFLVFLVVLQQIEGNLIYPRVVGNSIGLPGIWVLTAVVVGGGLFGLLGILLSVPVVSILYILLREDVRARLNTHQNSENTTESQQ